MIIDRQKVRELCQIYKKEGVECSVIRGVVPQDRGVRIAERGKEVILWEIYQDKLNKILSIEKQKG